ncbi:MAG: glucose-1-phosphate adenylyltransferase [Chloroflexi bacterium]|jgi:glucose-1-phosphate adenylyltransferase|nr:glucose-1-phosphate adenylyltransferase [Chloroflexota bacterium]
MPNSNEILAVILGGGQGKRLYPLTAERAKPAVPIAGKYRLIDIPISNCINSGIFKISVLTQFLSVSLHRHISRTYNFDNFHSGGVQVWAAEQTMENTDWYQGTADAVRKQIQEIRSSNTKHVLILAGDHLYRMDYAKMAEFHIQNNADITVAVQPVPKNEAFRFGILKRDEDGRITRFAEKPKDPVLLAELVSRDDPESPYLGSMGIYMFRMDTLMEVLRPDYSDHKLDDFGGDIIPSMIQRERPVYGFNFEGYWRDIGTIRTFYETNLELAEDDPAFDFYDPKNPIFTHPRFLPGSRVNGCSLKQVLMAEGSEISAKEIEHSVIGLRSVIGTGTIIRDTIVMGADWYGTLNNGSPLGIGRNCNIQGAIIDKNASIGDNVVIKPFPEGYESDHKLYKVREGIVVVPKHTTIPAGTVIQP